MDKAEIRYYNNRLAMVYGLYLGLFLVLKFIFEVVSLNGAGLGSLYLACVFAIPFVAYYMSWRFGLQMQQEDLRFYDYFRFVFFMFFFASTILAVSQYAYYAFINPSFIQNQYNLLMSQMDVFIQAVPQLELYKEQFAQAELPTPSMVAYQSIWLYSLAGALLGLPIAAILKSRFNRKNPN